MSPSVSVTSSIEIDGSSSFVIVASPWPSPAIDALSAFERSPWKTSSGSSVVSPLTATLTVSEVSVPVKVTVSECGS